MWSLAVNGKRFDSTTYRFPILSIPTTSPNTTAPTKAPIALAATSMPVIGPITAQTCVKVQPPAIPPTTFTTLFIHGSGGGGGGQGQRLGQGVPHQPTSAQNAMS